MLNLVLDELVDLVPAQFRFTKDASRIIVQQ